MAYTPSTTFAFSLGSYTPSATFTFAQESSGIIQGNLSGTLDGVSGSFIANVINPGSASGVLSGTLAGVTGQFVGNVGARGVLSAQLEGVVGQFVGNVAPIGVLSGTLDGVTGQFTGFNVAVAGRLNAVLDGISGSLQGRYDANVQRLTVAKTNSVQQDGMQTETTVNAAMEQTTVYTLPVNAPRDQASASSNQLEISYGQTTKAHVKRCGTLADAAPLTAPVQSMQDVLQWAAKHWLADSEQATPIDAASEAVMQQMTKIRRPDWHHPVQDMGAAVTDFTRTVHGDPANPYRPNAVFTFASDPDYLPNQPFAFPDAPSTIVLAMRHVRGIDGLTFVAPRQQAGPRKSKRCVPVQAAMRPPPGKSIITDPERPPYQPPPGHQTRVIPIQTVYTMQHTLSVKTVSGNVELSMANINLSYDADSFAWQFNGTLLDKNDISLVQAVDGIELAVTIDGYLWHVIIEHIEHGIQFAKHSITLKGRSLTAELGSPYKLPVSATMGSDLTVQQIADALMPAGWTIDWQAPTWLVPGGAFSYTSQTPIQALATLANDIGCVAVPHPSQRIITIQPRYPVYPWYFGSTAADIEIPGDALKNVSLRPAVAEQANGVYVHGGEIGGVLGWCRLNGSDGAKLAPTVSNSLMTDVIGCRLLGERILAGQWQQPMIKSATLPLDGNTFPLVNVGSLVQITLDAEPIKGIVNSVSIDATLSSVSQTIQIGEQTANAWTSFTNLLPRDPLLVGTIASTDGTTSVVTLLDGGVVSVRGTEAVGNKVYIRAGRIEGPSPAMVQNEIVI